MAEKIVITARLDFVARINDHKDCLMSQDETQENGDTFWFNIDVPKNHGFAAGDMVRVTVEKL